MSTRNLHTEPRPNRTRPTTTDAAATPRTATGTAPRTFSARNTTRLENLIDEWNAAFADSNAALDS